MQDTQLSQISNFIWGVADDYLRDLYVRGKYRDVILPMTVLRRLDAVLEPTKEKVLNARKLGCFPKEPVSLVMLKTIPNLHWDILDPESGCRFRQYLE